MPPRRCCCGCELGSDDFNRATLGSGWKVISGSGAIINSDYLAVSAAVVATTICHPAASTNGSYIAEFTLRNCRSVSTFEIGVGNPTTPSPYYVKWEMLNRDAINATIRISVNGTTLEVFDHIWPADPIAGGSADTVRVKVCYEPGALLRGSIGIPPTIDTCLPAGGAACYVSGADNVGGFFFKNGHFDDWTYTQTIIDDFDCEPCGCFCFRRSGSTKDFSCYPKTLHLNFTLSLGTCAALSGISIPMTQCNLAPGDNYPEKISWKTAIQTCSGNEYAFVLDCATIVKNGTNWLMAPTLRMTDNRYIDATTLFNWITPSINLSTRDADYATSTCTPLLLSYPGLVLNSFAVPCGPPGSFGFQLFCCPASPCTATPELVTFGLSVTI